MAPPQESPAAGPGGNENRQSEMNVGRTAVAVEKQIRPVPQNSDVLRESTLEDAKSGLDDGARQKMRCVVVLDATQRTDAPCTNVQWPCVR